MALSCKAGIKILLEDIYDEHQVIEREKNLNDKADLYEKLINKIFGSLESIRLGIKR